MTDKKSSSYDKIAQHLMNLHDWHLMGVDFLKFLESLHVTGCDYQIFRNYSITGAPEQVAVKYVVEGIVAGFPTKVEFENLSHLLGPDNFPGGEFLPGDWINKIVRANFGKTKLVPTYFCKLEKLEEKWPPKARQALIRDHATKVQEACDKLRYEWEVMSKSPQMEEGKTRCYELHVIKNLKKVLLEYGSKVRPEVLKEALDEYVTHQIMES